MARTVGAKGQHGGDWKPVFLAALRKMPNVMKAARFAGISRRTAYLARDDDPAFAEEWDDAVGDAIEDIEARTIQMAKGTDTKANALRIFLLKAYKPERYRDSWRGDLNLSGRLDHKHEIDLSGLTDEKLDQLEQLVREITQPGADRSGAGTPEAGDDLDAFSGTAD